MPAAVTNQGSSPDTVTLTVQAQNLYGIPGAKDMKRRTEAFVKSIDDDEYFPEFVAMEEVLLRRMRKGLKGSRKHPYFEWAKEIGCNLMGSGLAALSSYPIVFKRFVPFTKARNTDALINKGVLLTRIEHPVLGEIDFYTTHTQAAYKTTEQYDDIRQSQAEQIAELIQEESGDRTVFLMGDLNFLESHAPYRYLTESTSGPGFTDVLREMDPEADLETWRPENDYVADSWGYQRLDYIFLRPGIGWEWDRKKSLGRVTRPCDEEDSVDDVCLDSPEISDHAGVLAKLVFKRVEMSDDEL